MILRLTGALTKLGFVVLGVTMLGVLAAETVAADRLSPARARSIDTLIVLGGGVNPDATLDHVGRGRADTAAALIAGGKAARAIFTGTLNDPARPEGEAGLLRDRALRAGAPADALFLEPEARTTLENLRFAFALGDAQGAESYAIVTDAFHLPRALALAALLGRDDVTGVAAPGAREFNAFRRLGYVLREAMAWWYNLGKAAAWIGMGAAGMSEAERGAYVV